MKTPTKHTKESLALTAAIGTRSNVAVANAIGVTPGAVSQWKQGTRPVPATLADVLGAYLGIDPATICAKYAILKAAGAGALPTRVDSTADQRRPDLIIRRLENDVDSLRLALGALAATMRVHRPAEAKDAARAIRRTVPAKFVRQGYIHELLSVLEDTQELAKG